MHMIFVDYLATISHPQRKDKKSSLSFIALSLGTRFEIFP
jgi:hypothetical protein